jgi:hypothetical protein
MKPSALYRSAAVAGLTCAVLLLVNSARRSGLLPENDFTHAIAPLAALAGLFALAGLYLWQRSASGPLGLIGFGLNAIGLAGAFAIEYSVHFVFPSLDDGTVTALVDGGTGTAFRVTAIVLIVGVAAFAVASFRAGRFPRGAIALYAVGMIPGSLRNAVPEPVYLGGLVVAALGVAWLSLALYRESGRMVLARTVLA